MPKILIIDDETIFRKGLRAMISSWDEDWDVVGDARDGYEALELLERLGPDVILTDVRMPRMDGLQLQQICRQRFPHIACIVISGYEDFTYVQQSMRHGAKDYLLKPVERGELGDVLDRLKQDMRHRSAIPPLRVARQEEQLIRQHVGEHLIAGLLRGSVSTEEVDLLRKIGIEFDERYFACMVIKLDKQSVDKERFVKANPSLFQLYIQQFVQEILDHRLNGFSFIFSDTEVAALINLPDNGSSKRLLLETASSIRTQIQSLSNLTVTIGVGTIVEGVSSIPKTYNEAGVALLYRLIVGGDKVLEYEQTAGDNPFKSEMKKWSWEPLDSSISKGRTVEVDSRVTAFITDLCRTAPNPEAVHRQICKLLIHYYEFAENLDITRKWLGTKDIRSLLVDVCSISSIDELIEKCSALLGKLTDCIASSGKQVDQDPIQQSLRYLERHFRKTLSLKEVADHVYLNPAYFSSLFKHRTGKTFIEKLTELRVQEAKQKLALSDEKISVLAENTGFLNIRHFNRVFKQETGMTPKDYREQRRQS